MGQGDMQHVDDRAPGQILDALVVLRGHRFRIDHPGSGDGGNRRLTDIGLEIVLMDAGRQELQVRIFLGQLMDLGQAAQLFAREPFDQMDAFGQDRFDLVRGGDGRDDGQPLFAGVLGDGAVKAAGHQEFGIGACGRFRLTDGGDGGADDHVRAGQLHGGDGIRRGGGAEDDLRAGQTAPAQGLRQRRGQFLLVD